MQSQKQVRLGVLVGERRAREHAERGDWNSWLSTCTRIRAFDNVLEDEKRPGYRDPVERVPFSEDFARKYAATLADHG
jgi:hypothetical protein